MRRPRSVFALLIFIALFALAGESCSGARPPSPGCPTASSGVLDLRGWDLAGDGPVKLTGEWEFYWEQLLEPAQLRGDRPEMTGYISVPRSWNGYVVDGKKLAGDGYATYALTILTKPGDGRVCFRMPQGATAYRLWVNGRELAGNGRVSASAQDMVPQYIPLVVAFDNDRPEIQIVIQESNFVHRRGGMWEPLELGTEEAIRQKSSELMLLALFSLGSFLTMGFYHICLWVLRRKERSMIYFACLCLACGMRAMLVGEVIITKVWPAFSWALELKLEYMTTCTIVAMLLLFCSQIYPNEASKLAVRATQVVCLLFTLVVLVTSPRFFTCTLPYLQAFAAIMGSYVVGVLLTAVRHRREGALWIALGVFFFILTVLNDILYYNGIVSTGSFSPFGLVVVCFAQAFVLSLRFSGAMTSVEHLSERLSALNQQLTELNRDLELRVEERTAALLESHRRLEMINREMDRMEQSRKHLLNNVAHDLRAPVTLIQGYANAMLDGVIDGAEQRTRYLRLIRGNTANLSHLIEDLFELTQLESQRVTFNMGKIPVDELVRELYMKYETDIVNAGISPSLAPASWSGFPDGTSPVVNADPERIDRVFANLIYNAMKFTPRGGRIAVSSGPGDARDSGGQLKEVVVSIADTGSGISAEDLPYLFDGFYKSPPSRNRAAGSGVGLAIARETVELHHGRIWAEGAPEQGSKFSFTLPVAQPDEEGARSAGPPETV
jgi:signal transduction histidine kinase